MYYNRELYHAERWHKEFPSVMTVCKDMNIFVNDFVTFHHPDLSEAIGKVLKVFKKVK